MDVVMSSASSASSSAVPVTKSATGVATAVVPGGEVLRQTRSMGLLVGDEHAWEQPEPRARSGSAEAENIIVRARAAEAAAKAEEAEAAKTKAEADKVAADKAAADAEAEAEAEAASRPSRPSVDVLLQTMDNVVERAVDTSGGSGSGGDDDDDDDESEDDLLVHTVASSDTLGGLELRYGVSSSVIRRLNGMTTDRLTSHLHLKIPRRGTNPTNLKPTLVVDQRTERIKNLRVFTIRFPSMKEAEMDFYLHAAKGKLGEAVKMCERDVEWERENAALLQSRTNTQQRQEEEAKSPSCSSSRAWWSLFSVKSSSRKRLGSSSASSSSSSSSSSFRSSSVACASALRFEQKQKLELVRLGSSRFSFGGAGPGPADDVQDTARTSLLSRNYTPAAPLL